MGSGGCLVRLPAGQFYIPDGVTSVTVPAGYRVTVAQSSCVSGLGWTVTEGQSLWNIGSFTINVADATFHNHPNHRHQTSQRGATGTGFYCGRRYDWSDFAPDADRPLFLTAGRRSLMGWVYVSSDGRQVADCAGYPMIFRPDGQ